MHDKLISRQDLKLVYDKLGRHNTGFTYINKNGLNASLKKTAEFDYYKSFMLTKEMNRELKRKAKKQDTTVAELIRRYIVWGLENDK